MTRLLATVLAIAIASSASLFAQDRPENEGRAETLADIRQQLTFMLADVYMLREHLLTTGSGYNISARDTLSLRLTELEAEIRRMTGVVEDLQFQVEDIVQNGVRQVEELERRLVMLEGGDVSKLDQTTTLDTTAIVRDKTERNARLQRALSLVDADRASETERRDYESGITAYLADNLSDARQQFELFVDAYPNSPLIPSVRFWLGETLAAMDQWRSAARAYLDSYRDGPEDPWAPDALQGLGKSLGRLGQTEEACLALYQVVTEFPDATEAVDAAKAEQLGLGCT